MPASAALRMRQRAKALAEALAHEGERSKVKRKKGEEEEAPRNKSVISGVLRVRPPKPHEEEYMICSPKKGFTLTVSEDYVYGEDTWAGVLGTACPQHDVFLTIGLPIVEAVMAGRRACLFAYGQTGSGKTFSMYGADGGKNPAKLDGAVPAICAELFRRKTDAEKRRHDIKLAMFGARRGLRTRQLGRADCTTLACGSRRRVAHLTRAAALPDHLTTSFTRSSAAARQRHWLRSAAAKSSICSRTPIRAREVSSHASSSCARSSRASTGRRSAHSAC